MRKNFLLLFLMALLPLAGWAVDLKNVLFEVGDITYGSDEAPTLYAQYQGDRLKEGEDYDWDGKYYSKADCSDAGTNQYWLLTAGKSYYVKITGVYTSPFTGENIASFKVNKAPLTLTLNTTLSKTYGDDDPVISKNSFDGTGFKNGETTAVLEGTATYSYEGEDAGTHTVSFSGLKSDNYDITYALGAVITIEKRNLSSASSTDLVIERTFPDLVYKGAAYDPDEELTYSVVYKGKALVQGEDFTVDVYSRSRRYASDVIAVINATNNSGTTQNYYPRLVFDGNYAGQKDPNSFTVAKAPMSVEVGDLEKVYKGANYTTSQIREDDDFAFTYYGFVGEDVGRETPSGLSRPTITLNPSTARNVGTYEINATGGSSRNYALTIVKSGTLTIKPAEATLTARNMSKRVGQADPTLTYTVTGNVGSDRSSAVLVTAPTLTREEGEVVGEYEITINDDYVASDNYIITKLNKGIFTITPGAAITITVLNKNKVYGDDDPAAFAKPERGVDYIVSGAVKPEDVTVTKLFKEEDTENAGVYSLKAEYTYDEDNYDGVVVVPGTFTIKKAPLSVTLTGKDQTLEIGDMEADIDQKAFDYGADGLKNGDKAEDVFEIIFNIGAEAGKIPVAGVNADGELTAAAEGSWEKGLIVDLISDNYELNPDNAANNTGKLIVVDPLTTLVLDDTSDKLADVIEEADGQNCNVTFTSRVLKAGQWNTLVLPFATDVATLSELLGYAVVDVLNEDNTNAENISLRLHFGAIDANTPFLVQPAEDINLNTVTFRAVDIEYSSANPEVEDGAGHKFIGTYEGHDVTSADKSEYYYSSKQKKFVNASGTTHIGRMRAYLKDTSNSAKMISVEEPNGTTDIQNITAEGKAIDAEGWYNLNGVKLQGAPTQKGVYIKDGKKVIIK